jgi:phage FluMu protein Com
MPIDFKCANCGRMLRTGDDTAGKQAQCPECKTVMQIPGPAFTKPEEAPAAEGEWTFRPQSAPAEGGYREQSAQQPSPGPQAGYYGPSPADAIDAASASSRVSGPAIAMMVFAALGFISHIISVLASLTGALIPHNLGMQHQNELQLQLLMNPAIAIGSNFVGFCLCVVIFLGAWKMMKLENYGLAMAAAVISVIPCISPCCILGIPFGIWAIVVLSDPTVKSAFKQ